LDFTRINPVDQFTSKLGWLFIQRKVNERLDTSVENFRDVVNVHDVSDPQQIWDDETHEMLPRFCRLKFFILLFDAKIGKLGF
jgi:hypothetical protein